MTTRGTIFLETAEIIGHTAFDGDQHVLRLRAPRAARAARPGNFAHIECDPTIGLRRPLSIMRADAADGWIEFLYKPVGAGLAKLAEKAPGHSLSVLAPIGNSFEPTPARPRILAIGGGVGIPPMVFLAEQLAGRGDYEPIVLMGSELPFVFETASAKIPVQGAPAGASHAATMLESLDVGCRLASFAGLAGCHRGYVTDLARLILESLSDGEREATQLAACGPEAMLRAASVLARDYSLPCQLALEEFMACGVGGCAGCTVLVATPEGPAMKRVCVDGPVFDSRAVYASNGRAA